MACQIGKERGGVMSFNLAVMLSETAHAAPDRPVAVFNSGRLSYRQLDQASDRVAANLAAAGIEPGDRIALQLPNIAAVPDLLLRDPQGGRRRGPAQRPAPRPRDRLPPRRQRGHGPDHLGRRAGRGGQGRRGRRDRRNLRRRPRGRLARGAAVRAAARRRGATARHGDAAVRATPPSSSTPRGPRACPRGPSSPTSSCT